MRIARMDDAGVDGGVEDDFGMMDDVRIERIIAGDEHGHPPLPGPAGAPRLLPQGRQSSRPAGDDDEVEPGDVDAQLQGIRRRHGQQLARPQSGLEHPALFGQIPAPVRCDLAGQGLVHLSHLVADGLREGFGAAAGGDERDRPKARAHRIGDDIGCLDQTAAPVPARRHRGFPQRKAAGRPRRRILGHRLCGPTGQLRKSHVRVSHRRRGSDDDRGRAIVGGDAQQAAQDERDMGPEHSAVPVGLIDNDEAEVLEHPSEALVLGQNAAVEHVRVGEDDVRMPSRPVLRDLRGVPVIAGRTHALDDEPFEFGQLIGGQGLRRRDVDRRGGAQLPASRLDRFEHRQPESQ